MQTSDVSLTAVSSWWVTVFARFCRLPDCTSRPIDSRHPGLRGHLHCPAARAADKRLSDYSHPQSHIPLGSETRWYTFQHPRSRRRWELRQLRRGELALAKWLAISQALQTETLFSTDQHCFSCVQVRGSIPCTSHDTRTIGRFSEVPSTRSVLGAARRASIRA